MSDEFERMFAQLRGQQPPAPFAVPEEIRRRGRQRSQHQALAAGVAVVAVVGAGTGWAATLGLRDPSATPGSTPTTGAPGATRPPSLSPTPSAAPSGSPRPSRTPNSEPAELSTLVLRPADLGPGSWTERKPSEPFSGDTWRWGDLCPAYRSADYASLRRQADLHFTGYAAGSERYVFEHVHRYAAGWGPRALDDVRQVLTTCAGPSAPPTASGGPAPRRVAVVDTGFAGDESLLIREEQWVYSGETIAPDPLVTLTAVVRVGDLVGTVIFSPDRDEQYARTVADAAAKRLAGS